jgi:hypothetical protein
MLLSPLALDLAQDLIHQRLQRAAHDALIRQVLRSAAVAPSRPVRSRAAALAAPAAFAGRSLAAPLSAARSRLAHGVRWLAFRLDPALSQSR